MVQKWQCTAFGGVLKITATNRVRHLKEDWHRVQVETNGLNWLSSGVIPRKLCGEFYFCQRRQNPQKWIDFSPCMPPIPSMFNASRSVTVESILCSLEAFSKTQVFFICRPTGTISDELVPKWTSNISIILSHNIALHGTSPLIFYPAELRVTASGHRGDKTTLGTRNLTKSAFFDFWLLAFGVNFSRSSTRVSLGCPWRRLPLHKITFDC